jgi:ATP-dependent Lon protease
MPRDSQTKMSKKESIKHKKRDENVKKKKKNEESSDDGSIYSDDEEDDEMDVHEYRKFLKNMFPSKHLDNKIKAGERLKKYIKDDEDDDEDDDDDDDEEYQEETPKKIYKNYNKKPVKKKKNKKKEIDDDDDNEIEVHKKKTKNKKLVVSDDEEEEEEEEEEDDDDDDDKDKRTKGSKFNIIFTIGGKGREDDDDEDDDDYDDIFEDEEDWETCSGSNTENEDDSVSSDSEDDTEDDTDDDDDEVIKKKNVKTNMRKKRKDNKKNKDKDKDKDNEKEKDNEKNKNKDNEKEKDKNENDENKKKEIVERDVDVKLQNIDDCKSILNQLKEIQSKNLSDKSINKCIETYEADIKKQKKKKERKTKKEKARNGRIFKKILRDKNTMNDFDFYDKLETDQQKKIIKELREINKLVRVEKPYRLTLLESDIPIIFKSAAMKKISSLRYMEPGSGEYYKIKNWVDTFMRIPFGKYQTLPLSITDGVDKCHDFMENAQKTLDDAVYGLNDAKMQIMQMLGQLVTNPKAIGSAIAIHGPPGTGKTSLVKEGISKILNRPFAFIALGGATDSSFLEGHGYTYEGSTWGKIVQILIDSKCMNPVIYFDELDKISDTPKGEEIAGILTHLTDTSQNTQFHDKYFAEIDFDLSKCLFIFSYNDETKVNSILKDRMYRIQTKGYNQKQKTVIANNYLLPKIREQVKFMSEDIIIPDDTIHYIIENSCNKEDGVRNLKRCLEIIYTKLNLYRLMKPDTNLFEEDMSLKVQFPFKVTKDIVDKLIKKSENSLSSSLYMLYS